MVYASTKQTDSNEFKLVKPLKVALPRHSITFYIGGYNPNFIQQIIRSLLVKTTLLLQIAIADLQQYFSLNCELALKRFYDNMVPR